MTTTRQRHLGRERLHRRPAACTTPCHCAHTSQRDASEAHVCAVLRTHLQKKSTSQSHPMRYQMEVPASTCGLYMVSAEMPNDMATTVRPRKARPPRSFRSAACNRNKHDTIMLMLALMADNSRLRLQTELRHKRGTRGQLLHPRTNEVNASSPSKNANAHNSHARTRTWILDPHARSFVLVTGSTPYTLPLMLLM